MIVTCPECGGPTLVKPGYPKPTNTGQTRRRGCKDCVCQFKTYQKHGSDVETVALIIVSQKTADDEQLQKRRRTLLFAALWDVRLIGRVAPDTLEMAQQVKDSR